MNKLLKFYLNKKKPKQAPDVSEKYPDLHVHVGLSLLQFIQQVSQDGAVSPLFIEHEAHFNGHSISLF